LAILARMRALVISIASLLLTAGTALAASSGAYAALEAVDAQACAAQCASDGLCMMWVYRASNVCELRASISTHLEALAAGVSASAPQFARASPIVVVSSAPPAHPMPPQPRAPHHNLALLGGPSSDRSGLRARLGEAP